MIVLFIFYWKRRKRGPRYVKGQESHMNSPKTPKSTRPSSADYYPKVNKHPKPVKVTARSHQNSAASTMTSSVRHQPDVIAQVTSLTLPEHCPTAPVVVTRLPHPDDNRSRSPHSHRSRQLSLSDGGISEHLGYTAQVNPQHYPPADNMQHGADSVYDSSEEGMMEDEGSEEYYEDNQLTFQQQMPTHYHSLGSLVSNRSYHHHELSVAPPLQQNQYWV